MQPRIGSVEIIVLLLVLATFVAGAIVYPAMPERMPSHWNTAGEVNGEISRPYGVFLFPCILLVLYLLFFAIPRIDPLRANIQQFRKAYNVFFLFFMIFMIMLYVHTLLWSSGIRMNTNILIGVGIAGLMFLTSYLCRFAKRNYFVGIRTPWTLNSDSVWDKTHRLGSRLFLATGILMLIGILVPQHMVWFIALPIGAVALILIVYSYVAYEREQRLKT